MKIFEIIPELFDGGAERFIVDLSNQLDISKNHEVVLVSLYNNDKSNFLTKEINPEIRFIELGKKPGFDPKIIIRLFELIRREKPDIVHTHLRAIEYLLPIMFFLSPRFFHTIHNDAYKECPGKISRKLRNLYYKNGKCTPVTISNDSSESYEQAYGNNKNVQIENGRPFVKRSDMFRDVEENIKKFRRTEKTKVFVNIARITHQKNQIMLTKVFLQLVEEGYDLVLLIIGRVEDKDIFDEIERIKNDRILILHTKPNPVDYLYESDAFCLSSIYEGMPITIIEAFQTGCIPICTAVGGVKNMIENGANGFVSETSTLEDYKKSVIEFLNTNSNTLTKMKNNCIKTFNANYNISRTGKQYDDLFL